LLFSPLGSQSFSYYILCILNFPKLLILQLKKSLQEQRLRELAAGESLQQESLREHLSQLESRAATNRDNIIDREIKVNPPLCRTSHYTIL
jgi:hypothetical protein